MAKDLPQLTASELKIMKILWDGGRRSAREVHQLLGKDLKWAYSTTRTVLERMVVKGLLGKEVSHGLQLYAPKISHVTGLAAVMREFAEQVLDHDYQAMMSFFAQRRRFTAAELQELAQLLQPKKRKKV